MTYWRYQAVINEANTIGSEMFYDFYEVHLDKLNGRITSRTVEPIKFPITYGTLKSLAPDLAEHDAMTLAELDKIIEG